MHPCNRGGWRRGARSTSTTRTSRGGGAGFTVVELLLGLALSVALAAAAAPVLLSLERTGIENTDQTVWLVQQRVVAARFERDLRLACAQACPFNAAGAILEASESQVVFVRGSVDGSSALVVEWEVVNGSLMRRWGLCPEVCPATFAHSLYVDHKTMIEDLGSGSSFAYEVRGGIASASIGHGDLGLVRTVRLRLVQSGTEPAAGPSGGAASLTTVGRVGR